MNGLARDERVLFGGCRARSRYDLVVVGGGLIGLATALQLLRDRPELRVAVVEKETAVARHQSGRNSGVIHAGLYYVPGSLKARLCREGRSLLLRFAAENDIPHRLCGKLVVAVDETEFARLDALATRGRLNGLEGLRAVGEEEIRELEPNVRGARGLHVPETGVIDYGRVAQAYAREVQARGGAVLVGHRVDSVKVRPASLTLETSGGAVESSYAIACAGLLADRLAKQADAGRDDYRIIPFRGDYYTFRQHAEHLVRTLVYPVPDPSFPFLGVHFTRRIDGRLLAGPNAVPALAREGYRRTAVRLGDVLDMVSFPGFRRLARTYWRTGGAELWRDCVKFAFVHEMQRYVPAIKQTDVFFGPSGVRAQSLAADGSLVDDFLFSESTRMLHVLNAPSPGATASLAIGRELAERATATFKL